MFTRQQLYVLQRQFGKPGRVKTLASHSANLDTGDQDTKYNDVFVPRIVLLPASFIRSAEFNQAAQSAHRAFSFGGYVDSTTQVMILPPIKVDVDSRIIIGSQNYHVLKIVEEFPNCIVIQAKGVKNES